jgi:L-serine dehydratase
LCIFISRKSKNYYVLYKIMENVASLNIYKLDDGDKSAEDKSKGFKIMCSMGQNKTFDYKENINEKAVSVFNEVIGPIMRGPSSSHTAASFHIGKLARDLLEDRPKSVAVTFIENGSYAEVYHQQGSDLAFTAGLMGWSLTDERFFQAIEEAKANGLDINFFVDQLRDEDHPNAMEIKMISWKGRSVKVIAKSIGGGSVVFTKLNRWPIILRGDTYDVIVLLIIGSEKAIENLIIREGKILGFPQKQAREKEVLIHVRLHRPLESDCIELLKSSPGVIDCWITSPIFFPIVGKPLFSSGSQMVAMAERNGCSLGKIALAYEATLLGISENEALQEMQHRYEIMEAAALRGLKENIPSMQLLHPTAHEIYKAEREGRVAIGGIHTRAAARAMAVMHVNGGMGVVCAAPTGGAAGTIPGVVVTLAKEKNLSREQIALALFSASAIGLIVAKRATFAAEVAGCQVEIGAAGAMAAAAVVEAMGGTPRQAADAAAISFQNTMGSVCDLVQGIVEIPCHTRNAVAASGAFVCADLIMGGYQNPIPLDETIDAVYAVGKMLPRELRCTAQGGLSVTPSALALQRVKQHRGIIFEAMK